MRKFVLKKKPTTVLALLKAARRLLTPYERWTVNCLARDKNEKPCSPKSKQAVKFCAVGALKRCDSHLVGVAKKWLNFVAQDSIIEVNDSKFGKRNHARVLRMFDRAITQAAKARV